MLNIHIIGDGTILYSIKTLIELHLDKFKDEVQVTCFGDHYLNPAYVRKFTPSLTFDDIIRKADIVICTNPIYEDDNIVRDLTNTANYKFGTRYADALSRSADKSQRDSNSSSFTIPTLIADSIHNAISPCPSMCWIGSVGNVIS